MFNHFDKGLNIRGFILQFRPRHVVELGALFGKNTELIAGMRTVYPFQFTVITDNEFSCAGADVIRGISYKVLKKLPDDSIDMCLIDTDHNYWTLAEELKALDPKLRKDGIVLLHDTDIFYHDTGVAEVYANGEDYPRKEVEETGGKMGGIGLALIDWLSIKRAEYKLLSYTTESAGAAAIQKVCLKGASFYRAVRREGEAVCQI